jgi:hypothetical protein
MGITPQAAITVTSIHPGAAKTTMKILGICLVYLTLIHMLPLMVRI